ncbi:MAG: glycerol-3-phosphate dehydrogenase C-terminal domain-containing protein, partial [Nakamurella sp.]
APRPDWAGYLPAELVYAVTAEGALDLADVLARRTHLSIELPDGAVAAAPEIAELIGGLLGWTPDQRQLQLNSYLAAIAVDREALEKVAGRRKSPVAN